jgi:hypothetical protein
MLHYVVAILVQSIRQTDMAFLNIRAKFFFLGGFISFWMWQAQRVDFYFVPPKARLSPREREKRFHFLWILSFFLRDLPISHPLTTSNHRSQRRWEKAPVLLSYIRLHSGNIAVQCNSEIQNSCLWSKDLTRNITKSINEISVSCISFAVVQTAEEYRKCLDCYRRRFRIVVLPVLRRVEFTKHRAIHVYVLGGCRGWLLPAKNKSSTNLKLHFSPAV